MKTTTGAIAKLLGGQLVRGNGNEPITGFASLEDALPGQISFYANQKFEAALRRTKASAILIKPGETIPAPDHLSLIEVNEPAKAFDRIVDRHGPKPPEFVPGLAPGVHIHESVKLDAARVSVQPGVVILRGAVIGEGTLIQANAVIGEDVAIGRDCVIGPNVSIREGCLIGDRVIIHGGSVIGADGFGYEFEAGRHRKVPQLGIVRIESDVEIGASTTIDRARFGETFIGEGTKIDNQVQIGHNAVIGKHCIIVAQCGIAGSARIGNYVTLAARVGIAGHIEIADRVTVGGKSGVISSITEPGGTYFGYPAKPIRETLRNDLNIKKLGSLFERVKEIEKKLESLDEGENEA